MGIRIGGTVIGFAALLAAAAGGARAGAAREPSPPDPRAAVDALLEADRAFSRASAATDLVSGLAAMFSAEVVMPTPEGRFATGAAEAVAALRAGAGNAGARAEWTPVRGGVSADGEHGFTFGFLTVHRADGTRSPQKYMAYWVREPEGWRVAAYKRAARPEGEVSLALMPPALPARLEAPTTDPAVLEAHRASLDRAEREFSREAQAIGLGPAFAKHGSEDAVNMGRGPGYTVGAASIGAGMTPAGEAPAGSPVWWAPDRVLVASSGDLGVTIGFIHPHAAPAEGPAPAAFPFFTVWRRAGPGAPWRYVAE